MDVLQVRKVPGAHMIHPTEKPVALLSMLIEATTHPGALVLDPFAGSGSTAEACIHTNRNYIAIELADEYCDQARKRVITAKEGSHGNPLGSGEDADKREI